MAYSPGGLAGFTDILYNGDRAMVITNNYYSYPAKVLAKSNSCLLIDRSQLYKYTSIK
jgi:HJR/Mrr/RecB family endonuclease